MSGIGLRGAFLTALERGDATKADRRRRPPAGSGTGVTSFTVPVVTLSTPEKTFSSESLLNAIDEIPDASVIPKKALDVLPRLKTDELVSFTVTVTSPSMLLLEKIVRPNAVIGAAPKPSKRRVLSGVKDLKKNPRYLDPSGLDAVIGLKIEFTPGSPPVSVTVNVGNTADGVLNVELTSNVSVVPVTPAKKSASELKVAACAELAAKAVAAAAAKSEIDRIRISNNR
ncbi:hypothetical protein N9L47_05275 [Rhodobacteraceae bacterium]|nr:hypothetical protein [Paracoccaceae bacterium]